MNEELNRLRGLVYNVSFTRHLYRAMKVLMNDKHYKQKYLADATFKKIEHKYSVILNVKPYQHLLRPIGLFGGDLGKKWHVHFYRAWRSILGDHKYKFVGIKNAEHECSQNVKTETISYKYIPGRPTVLILSTYPYHVPRHGGQLRLSEICKLYESLNWNIHPIAIYSTKESSHHLGQYDIHYSAETYCEKYNVDGIPLIEDFSSGLFAINSDTYKKIIHDLPKSVKIIHAEQPWLWKLVEKLKTDSIYTVLSTQNIEFELKANIFRHYNINAPKTIQEIKTLEIHACQSADLVLCVTNHDLSYFNHFSPKSIILAPNATSKIEPSCEKLKEWSQKLPTGPCLLYIASAHPPNFTSLIQTLGDSLACIPPNGKLLVVGSVCEHVYRVFREAKWSTINLSRLQLLYMLADEDIAAVKKLAHAYLLPIAEGGGSNLKTPEAIVSGSYIISTKHAFRGFESYMTLQNVYICETSTEFKKNIKKVMSYKQRNHMSECDEKLISKLSWTQSLSGYKNIIEQVASDKL